MIRWKATIIPFIALLIQACGAPEGTNTSYNSSGFDVNKDEAAWRDTITSFSLDTCPVIPIGLIDEERSLLLGDSLLDGDPCTRVRWARAVACTWRVSDGALSESLSNIGTEYIHRHGTEFLRAFGAWDSLDTRAYAGLVASELVITTDADPMDILGQFRDDLEQNCSGCTPHDRMVLARFLAMTEEQLKRKVRP